MSRADRGLSTSLSVGWVRVLRQHQRGIPGGFAISGDAKTIYVANVWGQTVSRVRLTDAAAEITELALAPVDLFRATLHARVAATVQHEARLASEQSRRVHA